MRLLYVFLVFAKATLFGLRNGQFVLDESPLPLAAVFTNHQAPNARVLDSSGVRTLTGEFEHALDQGVLAFAYSAILQQYLCVFYNGTIQIYEDDWTLASERTVVFPEPILEGACAWNDADGSFWLIGKENVLRVDSTVSSVRSSAGVVDLRWNRDLEMLDRTVQFAQFEACPCETVYPRYLGDAGAIVHRTQQQLYLGYNLLDVDEAISHSTEANVSSTIWHRPNLIIEVDVQYYVNGFSFEPIVVDGDMEIRGGTLTLYLEEPQDGETLTLYEFSSLQGQFDDIVVEATDSCIFYAATPNYESAQLSVTISVELLCARGARFEPVLIFTNV